MAYKVGYIVGSLSKRSINRRLAQTPRKIAPNDQETTRHSRPLTWSDAQGFQLVEQLGAAVFELLGQLERTAQLLG